MRNNLVSMLDGIGIHAALGIETTARLFDSQHELAAHVSAIDHPVLVNNKNYRGAQPRLSQHPTLTPLIRACLGARAAMAPAALVVPLGTAAEEAVEYLADHHLLDRQRCLLGFPHPSGANGWRPRHYTERRERLTLSVGDWASTLAAG